MASISASAILTLPSCVKPNSQGPSSLRLASPIATRSAILTLRSSPAPFLCRAKPETVDKVMEIVKSTLALPADSVVTPESKFSDLGADSLDTVDIVMKLEETFDINIEEENSQNIATVSDAADLIDDLVQKKTAAV